MYPFVKRFLDIVMSAMGIVVASPLLLVLLPVCGLFKQERVCKDKYVFFMYKFRTMRKDTPKDVPTHLLSDPNRYITPMGRFLRKTSLDELPQLFHVLAGQMSFIGPRPALWNQKDLIAARDANGANSIRPGLTGLAQVRGRDELPIAVKAAYDGEYFRDMSFGLDCRIFGATLFAVVRADGVKEGRT